jgi:hypothetical protein
MVGAKRASTVHQPARRWFPWDDPPQSLQLRHIWACLLATRADAPSFYQGSEATTCSRAFSARRTTHLANFAYLASPSLHDALRSAPAPPNTGPPCTACQLRSSPPMLASLYLINPRNSESHVQSPPTLSLPSSPPPDSPSKRQTFRRRNVHFGATHNY